MLPCALAAAILIAAHAFGAAPSPAPTQPVDCKPKTVVLQLKVRPAGTVADVQVVGSSGDAIIDKAVADAAREWRFAWSQNGGTMQVSVDIDPAKFYPQQCAVPAPGGAK